MDSNGQSHLHLVWFSVLLNRDYSALAGAWIGHWWQRAQCSKAGHGWINYAHKTHFMNLGNQCRVLAFNELLVLTPLVKYCNVLIVDLRGHLVCICAIPAAVFKKTVDENRSTLRLSVSPHTAFSSVSFLSFFFCSRGVCRRGVLPQGWVS